MKRLRFSLKLVFLLPLGVPHMAISPANFTWADVAQSPQLGTEQGETWVMEMRGNLRDFLLSGNKTVHSNLGLKLNCTPSSQPAHHQECTRMHWPIFNSCSSEKLNLKFCLLFLDILRPQDIMKCDHTYNSRRNPINSFNIHADASSVCNHGLVTQAPLDCVHW